MEKMAEPKELTHVIGIAETPYEVGAGESVMRKRALLAYIEHPVNKFGVFECKDVEGCRNPVYDQVYVGSLEAAQAVYYEWTRNCVNGVTMPAQPRVFAVYLNERVERKQKFVYENRAGYSKLVYDALAAPRRKQEQQVIHVTNLLQSPYKRQVQIRMADKIRLDVADQTTAVLGSAAHSYLQNIMENNPDNEYLIEKQLSMRFENGMKLTGRIDAYDPASGTLYDFKTMQVTRYLMHRDGKDVLKQYIKQLNIYRQMMHRTTAYKVDKLVIVCILKDWTQGRGDVNSSWPNEGVVEVEVPIMDDDFMWEYITTRIDMHHNAAEIADLEDITPCDEDTRIYTGDVYAVMKGDNKRSSKNCDTKAEAEKWIADNAKPGAKYEIVLRPGRNIGCHSYCDGRDVCPYYKQLIEQGE